VGRLPPWLRPAWASMPPGPHGCWGLEVREGGERRDNGKEEEKRKGTAVLRQPAPEGNCGMEEPPHECSPAVGGQTPLGPVSPSCILACWGATCCATHRRSPHAVGNMGPWTLCLPATFLEGRA
jgi:hypothetical protein